MGWIKDQIRGVLGLNSTDRETIYKLFGSFRANKFGLSDSSLLEHGYESNVDVYSVIKKIADVSKSVEWIVEQKDTDGNWIKLEDSTLHELMHNPNPGKGYTWDDIEEMMLVYLLANGNSYLVGQDGIFSSTIREVDVLPSPHVKVLTNKDFFTPMAKYVFELQNQKRVYEPEFIEHIKLFNPSYTTVQESFDGLSIIQVAQRVVQVGNDRWDADASLLQNRGAIGMITDKSQRPMTAEESQKVQSAWDRETSGTNNYGKIKVTNKDLSFIQMAMNSTDLQMVEKGVVNLRAVCNVFGLDSSLFNDPANKTFNNRKEAEKALYTNAVIPISEKIAQKHTNYLAKNHYPDGNVRMRQDFSSVEALQADQQTEAQKDKTVMEGINIVLNMPISRDGKSQLLQQEYNLSAEETEILLTPEGSRNEILETLKSLSPLLANKLVDKLSDEEVRGLFNLNN